MLTYDQLSMFLAPDLSIAGYTTETAANVTQINQQL